MTTSYLMTVDPKLSWNWRLPSAVWYTR